mgnify:CR=1 FL=1
MTNVLTQARPIRLKGRSFLALALTPEQPFEDWLTRLDHLASRSTGFFRRRPVVLDINGLDIDRSQLRELIDKLAERNVRIMGIEGARPSLLAADLPPAMADGRDRFRRAATVQGFSVHAGDAAGPLGSVADLP